MKDSFEPPTSPATETEPRPTRIVFCVDNMQIGGTELNAVRTAERLDRSRFDLSVVCLREISGPLATRYREAGIPVYEFPIHSLHSPGTVTMGFRLARMLRARGADIFHAHDVYSNVFGVPWARFAGTPTVIASRRWWTAGQPKLRPLNRLAYRLAHRVLANSGSVGELLHREGVARERITVVSNFLDEGAFTPPTPTWRGAMLDEFGVPENAVIVGSVANLSPLKDHRTLLRAFALLTRRSPPVELRLLLIGDGSCRADLEKLAYELGVADRVLFAGQRENTPNLHHLFDLSVLSSTNEAFPNTILEAMAAGNAVVATRVGGTPDAVVEGETGLLVPPSNPDALAGAIDRLIRDADLRLRLGKAGLTRARSKFSADSAIESLEQLYLDSQGAN